MATSPSDPYKSRIVRTVLKYTRDWIAQGQTTVRKMRVAASWSTQVVLYPIYALFQTTRLLGQQLDKAVQTGLPSLRKTPPTPSDPQAPARSFTKPLTADSPLQHVLQSVQAFLPAELPVVLPAPRVVIRAIASSLESRAIVLVSDRNHVLDVLLPSQQQAISECILTEVANAERQLRPWQRHQRAVSALLQTVRSRLPGLPHAEPIAAGLTRLIPSTPILNAPIVRSLQVVRQILPAVSFPDQVLLPAIGAIVPAAVAPLTTPETTTPTTDALTPSDTGSLAPVAVRGVASQLETRSLVLVTTQNTVLDILTPSQQQYVQRRIIWEVAHYLRYLRLQRQTQRLQPLRPPSQSSQVLPPVRAFYWLMAWMQAGAIAAATNLFQETAITACPLPINQLPPASSPAPAKPTNWTPQAIWQQLRQLVWPQRLVPNLSTLPPIQRDRPANRPTPPSPTLAHPPLLTGQSSGRRLLMGTQAIAVSPSEPPPIAQPAAFPLQDVLHSLATEPPTNGEYIDTEVTLMGYEFSLLERIIRWLDRCLVWLEDFISKIWAVLSGKA